MIVLVCGGRNFNDKQFIFTCLDNYNLIWEIETILNGGATGADMWSSHWAKQNNIPVIEMPAEWKKYGRKAGPLRNQKMLDEYHPELVIVFEGGKGTKDMITRALDAKLFVEMPGWNKV